MAKRMMTSAMGHLKASQGLNRIAAISESSRHGSPLARKEAGYDQMQIYDRPSLELPWCLPLTRLGYSPQVNSTASAGVRGSRERSRCLGRAQPRGGS